MSKQRIAQSLDCDWDIFGNNLRNASELVVRLYERLDEARITPTKTRKEIASLFDESLPEDPQPMESIFSEVEDKIYANSTLYLSPRFFGYINSGGNQASILGELLAAAVNQILALWHFSPAASEVERRVIEWIAEFIGYPCQAGGCLLSGGSAGNLVGLAAARKQKAPFDADSVGMRGGPPLTVYASQEVHASVDKAMMILGMGHDQLRKIAVRDDFTIDLDALEKQVSDDRTNGYHPICVVGVAGTTNTGAVDPLNALADFCQDQRLWFHVDAAYGGPAARTEIAGKLFRGLESADSVVVNPHKWLYVPAEAACILVREPAALRHTFQVSADYLKKEKDAGIDAPLDFKDYSPQLHRNFRALKVWMTFKAYGTRKLRAAIESNIEIMRYLADRIDESQDFVRLAPVPLSVVCFQYSTADVSKHGDQKYLDDLNSRLLGALEKDGRIFLSGTTIHGKRALRACSVNHRLRREDVHFLLDVTRQVGRSLAGL
jgi:glutamate/tyrosine decarboxylase-like PLP-dependent enzyme